MVPQNISYLISSCHTNWCHCEVQLYFETPKIFCGCSLLFWHFRESDCMCEEIFSHTPATRRHFAEEAVVEVVGTGFYKL
jgi:hypothetical protein